MSASRESKDTNFFTGRLAESPLKKTARSLAVALGRLPVIRSIIHAHAVRDILIERRGFRLFYAGVGYETLHPFDLLHGTDTSGHVSATKLPDSEHSPGESRFHYWGSQPSYIRFALARLPSLETFTFVDLGCGKGRALFVASEFPLRDLVGVELSPALVRLAQKNAAIMEKRFPARTRVHFEECDVSTYRFPPGNLIVYLYNPFGEVVLAKVMAELERALAAERREIYLIYFYPFFASTVDASPKFERYFEATVPYAPEEQGYASPGDGAFIIWKSRA